jgi:hypothetical protein
MKAYIYKDNKLEKIEYLNNHQTLSTKGKIRLKRILTYLTRLSEKGESNYYIEVKIN